MAGPAVVGGVRGGGDQTGPLGIQPGARRSGFGDRRAGGGRPGDAGTSVAFGGVQGVHRGGGGVQVVVEQAGQRRLLPVLVMSSGELAGVGAQQVMNAMPARVGGLDQVYAGQLVKHSAKPAPPWWR